MRARGERALGFVGVNMEVTYLEYPFSVRDFVGIDLPSRFLADVYGVVKPQSDGGLAVHVLSVRVDGKREIASYLRVDKERSLEMLLRSFYMNRAREGHEGDSFNEESA